MQVQVNGHPKEIADGSTVAALLVQLDIREKAVAVEVNAALVTRARHAETRLSPGDQVEIVTFVGGG